MKQLLQLLELYYNKVYHMENLAVTFLGMFKLCMNTEEPSAWKMRNSQVYQHVKMLLQKGNFHNT